MSNLNSSSQVSSTSTSGATSSRSSGATPTGRSGMTSSSKVLIVAAEESSALYVTRLLECWKKQGREVKAFGIGNQKMVDSGFEAIERAENLSVMGFFEVLTHWKVIKSAFDRLLGEVEKRKPEFALLLDYSGFNLRLAKKLKALGIRVVYYISPQIWAWRQGRVNVVRKYVDKMLVLFPFEKEFYEKHNVPVEFVGHPLLDEVAGQEFSGDEVQKMRQRFGLDRSHTVLGLMPGSRKSELKNHLESQLEVAAKLRRENSNIRVAILLAPGFSKEEIRERLKSFDFPIVLVQDEPVKMIKLVDVVLCVSGTATLMVGLLQKPMVIMYRTNFLTAFLAKLLVRNTKFFGMVNLIMGREIVPERFQGDAGVENLTELLKPLLKDPSMREKKAIELAEVQKSLGDRGATERVARVLDSYF